MPFCILNRTVEVVLPISCTYRLQFNSHFTFKQAKELVGYFSSLGISHLYASPLFKSRSGSRHGYDIVDYSELNPEIGTLDDFVELVKELQKHQMKLILDIVPNHMAVGVENKWWKNLLEQGISSKYASFFDIHWNPSKTAFKNKLFFPILEKTFGEVLENGYLRLVYDKGEFSLKYNETLLPVAWQSVFDFLLQFDQEAAKIFPKNSAPRNALSKLLEEIKNGKEQKKQKVAHYFHDFKESFFLLNQVLKKFNGNVSDPSSFDALEKFIDSQNYHLCYWKVANDEINYRRFFDICEYASLKMENPEVFDAVHKFVFELIDKGWVQGLRIDHIDGLWDPQQYLEDLRKFSPKKISYLIVEKILIGNEELRQEWPIDGSVGYDFLNQVNGLFVFQPNKDKFLQIYERFTGLHENISQLKYECKKLILETSLASELSFLNEALYQIAVNTRFSRDFTWENLRKGLRDIIAWFPVYRSYIRSSQLEIHEEDLQAIAAAVEKSERNAWIDPSIYHFIRDLLLLKYQNGMAKTVAQKAQNFIMHFQQVTSAVMAKGLEDTAFYRYYPLSSLNEVGGGLISFGITKENFHKKNQERQKRYPYGMLATTTHDTKRSEDVRARINVLSEIPEEWEKKIYKWRELNQHYKIENRPDSNEEYLIYQTLLGIWPLDGTLEESHILRMESFMEKAINEAKTNSSWVEVNPNYQKDIKHFMRNILTSSPFLEDFDQFFNKIQIFAHFNSLSQLILKLTSPGVPDIYQGNERLDFSLVDPDNRRSVEWNKRVDLIKNSGVFSRDNREIKFLLTQTILQLRKRTDQLFTEGEYLPLEIEGPLEMCVIAFLRILNDKMVVVLTSRFFTFFKENTWDNHFLMIPDKISKKKFRDLLTSHEHIFADSRISLKDVFTHFPFAILETI